MIRKLSIVYLMLIFISFSNMDIDACGNIIKTTLFFVNMLIIIFYLKQLGINPIFTKYTLIVTFIAVLINIFSIVNQLFVIKEDITFELELLQSILWTLIYTANLILFIKSTENKKLLLL